MTEIPGHLRKRAEAARLKAAGRTAPDPVEERCDNCGRPVITRGVNEREYAHLSGSPFCTDRVATVNGRTAPEKVTPEKVLVDALTQITETMAYRDTLSVGEQASIILAALRDAGFAIEEGT